MTILGRYLSKMKLAQWNEYRWKDSQFLQDLRAKQIKETMENQGYIERYYIDSPNDKVDFNEVLQANFNVSTCPAD